MPGNIKPIIFLREKLQEIMKPGWIEPKPVYTACGLLLAAGIMMVTVLTGLQNEVRKSPGGYAVQPIDADVSQIQSNQTVEPQQTNINVYQQPNGESKQLRPSEQQQPAGSSQAAVALAASQSAHWPVKGEVTLEFGWQQHPVFNDWRYHTGIDISATEGLLAQAVFSGQVTDIYTDKNTGLTVVVDSGRYTIYYSSLAAVNVSLQKGGQVNAGDKIGTIGACTAEPYTHLHLAVKEDEKYIDPRRILK